MSKNNNEIEYLEICAKCKKPSDIGSYYCSKCTKEYDKTWYYTIARRNIWPKNMISGRPIKVFGIYLFCLLKIAKDNYEWACSKSYQKKCRCNKHKNEYATN